MYFKLVKWISLRAWFIKDKVFELNSGSIEKIGVFGDRINFFPNQSCEGEKLKKIKSLMVNQGSNHINPKPMTKIKKVYKVKAAFEI